jgi:uncharacterized protein (TIGR02246 family)
MTSSDADHEHDEVAILKLERDYDEAWNLGDVTRLASLYRPDAVVVNPLGERSNGRDAIREMLEAFITGPGRGSRHTSRISAIVFVQETIAVVDGEARLEGLGGSFLEPVVTHAFTDIVAKDPKGWSLAQTRAYVFATHSPVTA